MKNILTIFLLALAVSSFGQTYGWMIRIDPGQDADTANMGIMYPDGSGNLTGRMHFVSYATVLEKLAAFSPDTVYVNAGDSLVIVSIHGDTTYFAGGGGGGVADGDKGDITVSSGGTVWTIDNLAITNGKIANDAIDASKIAPDAVGSSEIATNAVGSSEIATGGVQSIDILDNTITGDDIATDALSDQHFAPSTLAGFGITDGALDADVVHKTGDETINGEKTLNDSLTVDDYAVFKGVDNTYATKIQMLKNGILQFNKVGLYETPSWLIKLNPFQTGSGNGDFGLLSYASANAFGSQKNHVYQWGINPNDDCDACTGLYWSLESHYQPTSLKGYMEGHLVFNDSSDIDRRIDTWFLDKGDPDNWTHAQYINEFDIRDPNSITSDGLFYRAERIDDNQSQILLLGSGGSTGGGSDGVSLSVNRTDNNFQITPYGSMPSSAEIYTHGFNVFNMNKLRVISDFGTTNGSSGVGTRIMGLEGSYNGGVFLDDGWGINISSSNNLEIDTVQANSNLVNRYSDQTINGEKTFNDSLRVDDYAGFLGTDGGYATKIEALKSGRLKFSKYNNTGNDYYTWLQIDDIQTGHGNVPWYSNIGTTSFVGDDLNNFTLTQGFNLSGGGSVVEAGKPGWGESWEYHYAPSISQILSEWHRIYVDSSGVQYRPESVVIDHGNLDSWYKYYTMYRTFWTDPNNSGLWADLYRDGTNGANFKLLGSGTGTGVQLYASGAGNLFGIYNVGMTDPHLYLFDSGTSFVHMRYLDFWPSGNPATSMVGMGGDGFATSMTYAVAADSLDLYMTSKVNVADTANMLLHYIERGDTLSMLGHYIERGDTSSMLNNYIDRSSAETIYGVKTFNADPIVPAEAYGSGWNGSNEPPTKNDVYDKIETLGGTSTPTTISPSQLTSDQDNYNPTAFGKAKYIRISSDNGMRAITSMVDSTGGEHTKVITNIGSYMLYFPMDHPDGTAANRFTGNSGDIYLFPGQTREFYYDATSSRWRCVNYSMDADRMQTYYDASARSTATGDNADLAFTAIGTGSAGNTAPSSPRPGYIQLSTASSSTAGYVLSFVKTANTYTTYADAHIFVECQLFFPTLSDGTETYTGEVQISSSGTSTTLEPNNTIGVRYSNGINSGKWELFTQSNTGTEATADLGVTVAANTVYKIRIEADKANAEARAYINGAYAGKVAINVNAVACTGRCIMLKSAGTTARTMNVVRMTSGAIYPY